MRRGVPAVVAALVLSSALAIPAVAQQDVLATPELLARDVSRLALEQNWDELAALMDPVALARLHTTIGRMLEIEPDPSMLDAFGVADVSGFFDLDPRNVMATLLSMSDGALGMMEWLGTDVLGIVREGDLAHLVVRQDYSFDDVPISTVDLISLRMDGDRWWLQLSPELEGMLIGFESQLPDIVE